MRFIDTVRCARRRATALPLLGATAPPFLGVVAEGEALFLDASGRGRGTAPRPSLLRIYPSLIPLLASPPSFLSRLRLFSLSSAPFLSPLHLSSPPLSPPSLLSPPPLPCERTPATSLVPPLPSFSSLRSSLTSSRATADSHVLSSLLVHVV
ncbi:hypothetical protein K523DRAFT_325205 [Schizophyllum commune Tattone D]|nr:hypothetical protein K523DRAFT_325205 [Schizophyllum commune Tattone D]